MQPDRNLYEPTKDCGELPALVPANAFEIVQGLMNAKLALQTGNARVSVRFGDRETTFSKTNSAGLASLTADITRWLAIAKHINPARYYSEGWSHFEKQFKRSDCARF